MGEVGGSGGWREEVEGGVLLLTRLDVPQSAWLWLVCEVHVSDVRSGGFASFHDMRGGSCVLGLMSCVWCQVVVFVNFSWGSRLLLGDWTAGRCFLLFLDAVTRHDMLLLINFLAVVLVRVAPLSTTDTTDKTDRSSRHLVDGG